MKSQRFELENLITQKRWICENIREVRVIDNEEYITVHEPGNVRNALMKKSVFKTVKRIVDKQ